MRQPAAVTRLQGRVIDRIKLAFLRLTGLSLVADENYLLFAALIAGVMAGLGATSFLYCLRAVHALFFGPIQHLLGALGPSSVIFLPALGGLLVGPFVARFAPEARGHGVPEVMTAVATRAGKISGRVAVVKILASAFSIGSGGSAGQEGPMVQIGAAVASAVGQRMRVSPQHMRTIVACGAAGGLAAVFNAPIGGAMFALEVITGELTPAFGAVILASVSATVVSRWFFGNYPSFLVPRYDLVSNRELLLYAVFGIVAGLVSVGFIRMSEAIEGRFERLQVPARLKPAIGGLMVGLIARFAPQVMGTGSATIEAATWGRLLPVTLALLVPLKMLATSTTLGSGGSGGVFGPSMYLGAVLGGAFGWAAHALLPASTAGPGAYALVGIGAVVGGTALAPLTAIILLFEMTDDYRIILPVMEATVLSIVVVRALVGESIYTLKLRQQNIPYYAGVELERARAATAAQAMRTDIPPIAEATEVFAAMATAARLRAEALAVVDDAGEVVGLVSIARLAEAAAADPRPASIGEIAVRGDQLLAGAGERLDAVLTRLSENDADALAVVSLPGGKVPIGVISRRDIMRVYERALRRD